MRVRQQRGQTGEDAGARYLTARGYRVIARNWRPGHGLRGEIDCIAWHGNILCFIEVKARTSSSHGQPQEAVTPAKQSQLSRLANAYVSFHRLDDVACRFDVLEVRLATDTQPSITLHQNAFDFNGQRRARGARIF